MQKWRLRKSRVNCDQKLVVRSLSRCIACALSFLLPSAAVLQLALLLHAPSFNDAELTRHYFEFSIGKNRSYTYVSGHSGLGWRHNQGIVHLQQPGRDIDFRPHFSARTHLDTEVFSEDHYWWIGE